MIKTLDSFIEKAALLGISESDIKTAQDFLKHQEYGLCFDTIVTQMYEQEIKINLEFYSMIEKIAHHMELSQNSYSFMKELISDK